MRPNGVKNRHTFLRGERILDSFKWRMSIYWACIFDLIYTWYKNQWNFIQGDIRIFIRMHLSVGLE